MNRIFPLACFAGLAFSLGCGHAKESGSAEPSASAESTVAAAEKGTDEAGAEAGGDACDAWGKALCDKAGEDSEICVMARTTAQIMTEDTCALALKNVEASYAKLGDLRKVCDDLAEKLCNDLGKETDTCAMVKERTPSFPTAQCEGMLAQYGDVLAELESMEARNKPLSAEDRAKIEADDAPFFGVKDAKVVLVEFSDFECPYCARAAETTAQIKEKYEDRIRFVFRQFPLSFHQEALPAAMASLYAHGQGKFWEFHDKVFENQHELSQDKLLEYGKALGLNEAELKTALNDEALKNRVEADIAMGSKYGVQGTPTLYINGKIVENPMDFEGISAQIEALLSEEN